MSGLSGRAADGFRPDADSLIGVTGASGFLGRHVCEVLRARGEVVRPLVRQALGAPADSVLIGSMDGNADWSEALRNVVVLVHCAGHVHQMQWPGPMVDDDVYWRINTEGTLNLARSAAAAGVRRLVFISTVKVFGEFSVPGSPLIWSDPCAPSGAYARSKCEAERRLRELESDTGLEVVVIRPPLVYGPGVGANFRQLMAWIHKGYPLPFASLENQRSLISRTNLVDLVICCLKHPDAAGRTFLASDGVDLSTPELIRRLADAMERPARLFSAPDSVLKAVATWTGFGAQISRLSQDLRVDIDHTREVLGWRPVQSQADGLKEAARAFLHS